VSADDNFYFDAFAHDYEQHAADSAYNALYDRPSVLALCGDVRGLRVFDAGCGPGLYAEALLARGAREVEGVDASETMVSLARERVHDAGTFRVHDLQQPLSWIEASSFDLAVMALVIHHIDDRLAALRELHRILRPDGALVVSTHHPTSDWVRRGGSYFDVSVVTETWNRGWDMRFWRLPLTRTAAEFFDAGFVIERLVEPLPAPEMAEEHPDDYRKLQEEPGFIAFRLTKRR
jgi:ubiquinone/menaquinone biosynthesis C-methylase UbiE